MIRGPALLDVWSTNPRRWRKETLAVALTFRSDRSAAAWVEALDAIDKALAPIVAEVSR